MNQKRAMHRHTVLNNGDVLITGGVSSLSPIPWPLSSAEYYSYEEKKIYPLYSMNRYHTEHATTVMEDGDVLIAGGHLNPSLEWFKLKTGEFIDLKPPQLARAGFETHVVGGMLYLIGGYRVEIHFQNLNEHQLLFSLVKPQFGYNILPHNNLEIYELNTAKSELIDFPAWLPKLTFYRSLKLSNGNILIVGGMGNYKRVIEFDIPSKSFRERGVLQEGREDCEVRYLNDHELLIAGGTNDSYQTTPTMEIFDLSSNTSRLLNLKLNQQREDFSMIPIGAQKFAFIGGEIHGNPDQILSSAEVLDLTTQTIQFYPNFLPGGRSDHQGTLLPDGTALVTGGENSAGSMISSAMVIRF